MCCHYTIGQCCRHYAPKSTTKALAHRVAVRLITYQREYRRAATRHQHTQRTRRTQPHG